MSFSRCVFSFYGEGCNGWTVKKILVFNIPLKSKIAFTKENGLLIIMIIIINTSYAPISSKIKLGGATKPSD